MRPTSIEAPLQNTGIAPTTPRLRPNLATTVQGRDPRLLVAGRRREERGQRLWIWGGGATGQGEEQSWGRGWCRQFYLVLLYLSVSWYYHQWSNTDKPVDKDALNRMNAS
jgi:hypothetical protein